MSDKTCYVNLRLTRPTKDHTFVPRLPSPKLRNDALERRDHFAPIYVALLELQPQVKGFRRRPVLENERTRPARLRLGRGRFSRLLPRRSRAALSEVLDER